MANSFCVYVYVCVYVCSSLVRFFVIQVSFEKLKSNYNQTWVSDVIGVPSYVKEVRGHIPRWRVIWGQVSWKMYNLYDLLWKVEVQLQLNLICRCDMLTYYSVSEWGLV